MPRLAGHALLTPFGDLDASFAALLAGRSAPGELAGPLLDLAEGVARAALGGVPVDLVILATTKGDAGRWCAGLLTEEAGYPGGPAWLAAALGERLAAPGFAVSGACASGPLACGVAARWLRAGRARRVVVVGADRIGDFVRAGFAALRAIASEACRPFDAGRDGLVLGETLAAVVLEADDAPGLHLAGWGATLDACHLTAPARDGAGLRRAVQAAAGGAPTAGALLVAHGTGTRFNDDAEAHAYAGLGISAVTAFKGAFGHSLGACGIAELALAAEILRQGRVPGVIGLSSPGCAAPLPLLSTGAHALTAPRVLLANAGFGGVNGALLLDRAPAPAAPPRGARLVAAAELVEAGWRRWRATTGATAAVTTTGLGAAEDGRWSGPPASEAVPLLSARAVLDRVDATWGRMDLACRALVALGTLLGPHPSGTGIVLFTTSGCAATDRDFERQRRAGVCDPQRFPYTLPTAPIGEASIRLGLDGPGLAVLGADAAQQQAVCDDLLAWDCARLLVGWIEADGTLSARAELWQTE